MYSEHNTYMTPCTKMHQGSQDTRASLAAMRDKLIADGRSEYASEAFQKHRLLQCLSASKCRRLCPRLVKAYGRPLVWCVDVKTGDKTPLYDALEDPAFECPEGLF